MEMLSIINQRPKAMRGRKVDEKLCGLCHEPLTEEDIKRGWTYEEVSPAHAKCVIEAFDMYCPKCGYYTIEGEICDCGNTDFKKLTPELRKELIKKAYA